MSRGPAIGIGVGIAIVVIAVSAYLVSEGSIEDNIGNQPDVEEIPNVEEDTGEGQRFTINLEDGIGAGDSP